MDAIEQFRDKQSIEPRSYSRGQTLYSPGETPSGIYYVASGLVGLIGSSSKGHEHLLRLFKTNELFGHRSLLSAEPYHAKAICIEKSKITFYPATMVHHWIENHPEFLQAVTKTLAQELRRAEILRITIADEEVQARVASSLVVLKELYPEHQWTRNEIANFCASTTPTVIRALARLEGLGYIEQKSRDINILDRGKLLELSSESLIF